MNLKVYKDKRLLRIPEMNIFRWRKKGVCVILNKIEYDLENIIKLHGLEKALDCIDNILDREYPEQVYIDAKDVRAYLMSRYSFNDMYYHQ